MKRNRKEKLEGGVEETQLRRKGLPPPARNKALVRDSAYLAEGLHMLDKRLESFPTGDVKDKILTLANKLRTQRHVADAELMTRTTQEGEEECEEEWFS